MHMEKKMVGGKRVSRAVEVSARQLHVSFYGRGSLGSVDSGGCPVPSRTVILIVCKTTPYWILTQMLLPSCLPIHV